MFFFLKFPAGIPVVRSEISKLAISNKGEVIQKTIDAKARKIPFRDKEKSPNKEKALLKIKDDNYYTHLNRAEIISELQNIHEVSDDVDEMRSSLKKYQCQTH